MIRVRAIRFSVNAVPEDDEEAHAWELTVEWRGGGRWAVCRHGYCLNRDGQWDWELRPSERDAAWVAAHRFGLRTAVALARQAAPLVTVSGLTPAGLRRWREEIAAGADPDELRQRSLRWREEPP